MKCYNKGCFWLSIPDDGYECEHINHCKLAVKTKTNVYAEAKVHNDVSIMVCDLSKGFCWWDENGERHDEDGFRFPEMKLIKADVQILHGKERSAAWQPIFPE